MKNIFKTVVIITLFTIFTRISGFIFRIWLSKTVGAEGIGIYQVAFSFFAVLVTLVCSGIPLTVSRLTAKYRALDKKNLTFSVVSSAMIVALLSSIFLCLIIYLGQNLFSNFFTSDSCMFILITLLPAVIFSAVHGVIRGYLWGEEDYLSVCVIELIEQYVRIIACVILLNFAHTALGGAISASLSLVIAIFTSCVLILIVYFKRKGKFYRCNKQLKPVCKSSFPITALRTISSLIMPIISLVLPAALIHAGYTENQALALYGIAFGMAYPLLFVPTTIVDSLALTLISTLPSAQAVGDIDEVQKQTSFSFNFALFCSALFLSIFLCLGEAICIFLFDSALAGDFLAKASSLCIPLALSSITTTMLNSLGKEKQTFYHYLISLIPFTLSLLIFVKFLGIDSVILSMFLQSLTCAYLNIRLLIRSSFLQKSALSSLVKLVAISLFCSIVTYNIYNILSMFFTLFFSLLLSGILCSLLFVIICQAFKLFNIVDFVRKLLKKRKKGA